MQNYLTAAQAAEYCGYSPKNPDHFRGLVEVGCVPTYGPGRKRWRISDLDIWMEDQHAFTRRKTVGRSRRGFTPV